MKIHYTFCLTLAALFSACSSDTETIVTSVEEIAARPTAVDESLFPVDDGAKELRGTAAYKLRALLENADPAIGNSLGYQVIEKTQYQEIKEFTDDLVKECANNKEKYQKIFKWIVSNIRYSYEGTDNNPYPVFINKTAICQGYANLLKIMLHSQDIPCILVNGDLKPIGGHAWNYVCVDGTWYVSDPTNNGSFLMSSLSSYTHLDPYHFDAVLYEDEQFVYNFHDKNLNIKTVKHSSEKLVLPYSIGGYKISSFMPDCDLPGNIRELYIGSNITTFGDNAFLLSEHDKGLEMIYVDPTNKKFASENGIVYYKSGSTFSVCYIPAGMTRVELKPMKVIGKSLIFKNNSITEIVFPEGTEKIESYAIEFCPNLKVAYVPENTVIEENAFCEVHSEFKIIRRSTTGIHHVTM
ncbi:MAG TPA: transglutaminase domain-containing protein [Alloprevotella sp.]|nr:transglutaminase domain-containing protein [Alloprevotella sp.]